MTRSLKKGVSASWQDRVEIQYRSTPHMPCRKCTRINSTVPLNICWEDSHNCTSCPCHLYPFPFTWRFHMKTFKRYFSCAILLITLHLSKINQESIIVYHNWISYGTSFLMQQKDRVVFTAQEY
jgi:hypothetical protein